MEARDPRAHARKSVYPLIVTTVQNVTGKPVTRLKLLRPKESNLVSACPHCLANI